MKQWQSIIIIQLMMVIRSLLYKEISDIIFFFHHLYIPVTTAPICGTDNDVLATVGKDIDGTGLNKCQIVCMSLM